MTPYITYAVFAFLFGAVVGSFLNVCICRMPSGESVVSPPSHCPKCDYQIRWYDNIPILSYLLLGGKCRSCKTPISIQYPLVELLNGLLALALYVKFFPQRLFEDGAPIQYLFTGLFYFSVLFIFCSALVVVTFIDLEHQIIPDRITLPGIVLGFVISFFIPQLGWLNSLIGILAGGGSLLLIAWGYQVVAKKDGMGGGDVKLLAMMGAFLGWKSILFIVFVSSLLGSVIGVTLMMIRKKDSTLAIPFGPFLAAAAVLYVFYGRQIIHWYLNMGR
ncbi:prepilin peptidase [Geomonas anaerohicana]|uniref:Prepilin leader peptidase/N-methyltransferase n=1 Tax=Geomonas anaerohicana TaxID=2798583 RepID=A0ABS0YBB9_9BACT|nr:A24 family peptidase [Geomonas anaerohicana]MBJ6749605.1 prepilin peptidase [Geomonas anaerohicana]